MAATLGLLSWLHYWSQKMKGEKDPLLRSLSTPLTAGGDEEGRRSERRRSADRDGGSLPRDSATVD